MCRLRSVITTILLSIACVRAQAAAAGLAQCDAHGHAALRCADAPKGLPAARSLCVLHLEAQPGNQVVSLSRLLPLSRRSLSSSPLSLLPAKPSLSHTLNTHTHITMSTRSTRKRKNEEEELVELPEDSEAESEEE